MQDTFPQNGSPLADTPVEQNDSETFEIKRLAAQHDHLDLAALAPLTRTEEGGSQSDRFRSFFGYAWLKKACGAHMIRRNANR